MDNMNCSIFNDLVCSKISSDQEFYVARQNGTEKNTAYRPLEQQSRFWSACFGNEFIKHSQAVNVDRSCIFIAPMGMIVRSFADDDGFKGDSTKRFLTKRIGVQHS